VVVGFYFYLHGCAIYLIAGGGGLLFLSTLLRYLSIAGGGGLLFLSTLLRYLSIAVGQPLKVSIVASYRSFVI